MRIRYTYCPIFRVSECLQVKKRTWNIMSINDVLLIPTKTHSAQQGYVLKTNARFFSLLSSFLFFFSTSIHSKRIDSGLCFVYLFILCNLFTFVSFGPSHFFISRYVHSSHVSLVFLFLSLSPPSLVAFRFANF